MGSDLTAGPSNEAPDFMVLAVKDPVAPTWIEFVVEVGEMLQV